MNNFDNEKLQKELKESEIKIDYSTFGKSIDDLPNLQSKQYQRQKKKEDKKILNDMKTTPKFLMSFAGYSEKILHVLLTIYSIAGFLIIPLCGWQVYKVISSAGWQGIFHTKYSLFILLYFLVFFLLRKVQMILYKYSKGV